MKQEVLAVSLQTEITILEMFSSHDVRRQISQAILKATRQWCGKTISVWESVNASQPLREQSGTRLLLCERFLSSSSSSTATVSLSPALQASWTLRGPTAEKRRTVWAQERNGSRTSVGHHQRVRASGSLLIMAACFYVDLVIRHADLGSVRVLLGPRFPVFASSPLMVQLFVVMTRRCVCA